MLYLLSFLALTLSTLEARPFCYEIAKKCAANCLSATASSLTATTVDIPCTLDCICSDPTITGLITPQQCKETFRQISTQCKSLRCIIERFCRTLPPRCCNPNELAVLSCLAPGPECCDGTWICPDAAGEYNCPDTLIGDECCCDSSSSFSCFQGARQCCPNDGQWACAADFPPTKYLCSDGNFYSRGEFADECCCDPLEQPGRFGNPFCFEGAVCCPDGTWSCGIGDGTFSCGGRPQRPDVLPQGEVCTCPAPDICPQVVVCCDGIVFSTPCAAQAACYDTSSEFCTFDFVFEGDTGRFCSPRENSDLEDLQA